MATDPLGRGVMLFGGRSNPAYEGTPVFLSDTWLWADGRWTRQQPQTNPSPRGEAAVALDPIRRQVVLFGGRTDFGNTASPLLGDTWTWDGAIWVKVAPTHQPESRSAASMAFDPRSGTLVMFGGSGDHGLLTDVWSWTGDDWQQIRTSVSPPVGATLVGNPAGGVVTVGSCAMTRTDNHAYLYQDSNFTASPMEVDAAVFKRCRSATAYDPAARVTLIFGGTFGFEDGPFIGPTSDRNADTMTFNGAQWHNATLSGGPAGRQGSKAAYDPASEQVVLFGGDAGDVGRDMADTWTWDPRGWTRKL